MILFEDNVPLHAAASGIPFSVCISMPRDCWLLYQKFSIPAFELSTPKVLKPTSLILLAFLTPYTEITWRSFQSSTSLSALTGPLGN